MQQTVTNRTQNNPLRRDFWFGMVDSRPLSAFRIVFALMLIKDALYHLPVAGLFYGDDGVLPRLVLWGGLATPDQFSLMDAIPYDWMAALFFFAWAVVAMCLLVGYRTRLMTILNFVIVVSIHQRNIYVLTGADAVIRVLSFWIMFLPLAHYYSLDALRKSAAHPNHEESAYAFPLRMIQLQVALIYLVTGILKAIGPAWQSGEALYSVLQINTLLLPLGQWLGLNALDWFLRLIAYGVIVTELAFILLVFAPIAQPKLKAIALIAGAILHIGIALTMVMPMTDFSLLMLTSYLLFFEPRWANRLATSAHRLLSPTLAPLQRSRLWQRVHASILEQPPTQNQPSDIARSLLTGFLAAVMVLVLWWNLSVISDYADTPFLADYPPTANSLIRLTGLFQYWDMFAPLPLQQDGWIRIPGLFEDGSTYDLFDPQAKNSRDSSTTPPAVKWGPDMRWQKYVENINRHRDHEMLLALGRYYCWLYNTSYDLPEGSRLATLEIHFMYRRIHAYGEPANPLEDDLLWSHWCYDEYAPKD
jgi:hypothetical protein